MPLKPLSYADAGRKLVKAGFEEVRQNGSHVKFAKQESAGISTAIVPRHKEIAVGTIRSILRQAGISVEEWEAL